MGLAAELEADVVVAALTTTVVLEVELAVDGRVAVGVAPDALPVKDPVPLALLLVASPALVSPVIYAGAGFA